jgi:hypothetical protein
MRGVILQFTQVIYARGFNGTRPSQKNGPVTFLPGEFAIIKGKSAFIFFRKRGSLLDKRPR